MQEDFVALDFETADREPDSACALALVKVSKGQIVKSESRLIQPPRFFFEFTHIHGITWAHVADAPAFSQVWSEMLGLLDGAKFLAAHNAPFDQGVLAACCAAADIKMPPHRFVDTVRLARATWNIFPTKLPNVCEKLSIPLKHHDPKSDAEACAKIVIAAMNEGVRP